MAIDPLKLARRVQAAYDSYQISTRLPVTAAVILIPREFLGNKRDGGYEDS